LAQRRTAFVYRTATFAAISTSNDAHCGHRAAVRHETAVPDVAEYSRADSMPLGLLSQTGQAQVTRRSIAWTQFSISTFAKSVCLMELQLIGNARQQSFAKRPILFPLFHTLFRIRHRVIVV
jgi:hypothetical protein